MSCRGRWLRLHVSLSMVHPSYESCSPPPCQSICVYMHRRLTSLRNLAGRYVRNLFAVSRCLILPLFVDFAGLNAGPPHCPRSSSSHLSTIQAPNSNLSTALVQTKMIMSHHGDHTLASLAESISADVQAITEALKQKNLPEPSFSTDSPMKYPNGPDMATIQEARMNLITSAWALEQLAAGPQDFIYWHSYTVRVQASRRLVRCSWLIDETRSHSPEHVCGFWCL
jgi:hypothetical protein